MEKHRAITSRPIIANARGGRGGRGSVTIGVSTRGGAATGGRGRGRGAPKDKMAQLAAYFV